MNTAPLTANQSELILFVGLQASGKTSFYQQRFAATHTHVSKDNFLNNSNPSRRQAQLIGEALAAGRPVVLDNTNPRRADRADAIAAAKAHSARIIGYYFSSRLAECIDRNAQREGKKRIADVGLRATAKTLELPHPSEGFDALYFVRLQPGGGFEVSEWKDCPEPLA